MSRESERRADREERRTAGQESAGSSSAGSSSSGSPSAGEHSRTPPAQFLKEVRSELRKVAWPDRKEVTSYTIVVLVTTIVLVLVVWGMDEVIRRAVINTLG